MERSGDPFGVLTTPAPSLDEAAAERIARDRFGLAASAEPFASERDRNFRLKSSDGTRYVLKISNAAEPPEVLDLQAQALAHVARVAPDLPVPHIVPGLDGEALQRIETAQGGSYVRVVSYLDGLPLDEVPWTPALRGNLARAVAGLGDALRGFFHPAAGHALLWDVKWADTVRPLAEHIVDPVRRALAHAVFERHARRTAPLLPGLRAQVIHGDCNPDNVLVSTEDPARISGIIDFGDMVHAPLINDLAVTVAYQLVGEADPLSVGADLVGAYHAVRPLEPVEIDVLADLIVLRLAMSICICAWRARHHPENVDYILGHHERYWRTLEELEARDRRELTAAFRSACGMAAAAPGTVWTEEAESDLRERRRRRLSPGLTLSYDEPLHVTRGKGAWLYDARGVPYLDAYNNVACVGHSHPAVVEAIAAQARQLNTNTRYLHEHIVTYAERLTARLPDELSVCFFVCTGSEANDLAWQIARTVTGHDGAIVTDFAYHGNTAAVSQLSPEELGDDGPEEWVTTVPAPDRYRGGDDGEIHASAVDDAIVRLAARGRRPAAFFVDTIFTSDGIHVAPSGYLAGAWRRVRDAGGLCVADEVQAGLGRTGTHCWGFEQQEVVPDIVTLGKPMGNGHPLAAVVTTPTIAAAFARDHHYFNTFGGNPVACAAGLAVLDVLEREGLQENARLVGEYLRERLAALATRHESMGDVRGAGLFVGVELVSDRDRKTPAAGEARRVVNEMRRRGVLVGRTGLHGNVLKVRPPLVFSRENARQFVDTLDAVLAG